MYGSSLQKKCFFEVYVLIFLGGGGCAYLLWGQLPLIHSTKNNFLDMVQVYITKFFFTFNEMILFEGGPVRSHSSHILKTTTDNYCIQLCILLSFNWVSGVDSRKLLFFFHSVCLP